MPGREQQRPQRSQTAECRNSRTHQRPRTAASRADGESRDPPGRTPHRTGRPGRPCSWHIGHRPGLLVHRRRREPRAHFMRAAPRLTPAGDRDTFDPTRLRRCAATAGQASARLRRRKPEKGGQRDPTASNRGVSNGDRRVERQRGDLRTTKERLERCVERRRERDGRRAPPCQHRQRCAAWIVAQLRARPVGNPLQHAEADRHHQCASPRSRLVVRDGRRRQQPGGDAAHLEQHALRHHGVERRVRARRADGQGDLALGSTRSTSRSPGPASAAASSIAASPSTTGRSSRRRSTAGCSRSTQSRENRSGRPASSTRRSSSR